MPSRRVTAPLPEPIAPLLPIHPSLTSSIRSLHAKYPPKELQKHLLESIQALAEASADYSERRKIRLDEAENEEDEEDDQQAEAVARLGKDVEDSVRRLLDRAEEGRMMANTLKDISERDRQRVNDDQGVQPLFDYEGAMLDAKNEYNRKDMKAKYGNVQEYVDYRKLVHASTATGAPFPNTRELLRTPLFVTRIKLPEERDVNANDDDDDEEEFEITNVTQSLTCPLTLALFENPVVSPCDHYFEKTAIASLFTTKRQMENRRAGGNIPIDCPTPGCNRKFKENELQESRVMKRRIDQEKRRLERERDNAASHETQNRRRKVGETLDMTNGGDDDDEMDEADRERREAASIVKKEKMTQQSQGQSARTNNVRASAGSEADAQGDSSMMENSDEEEGNEPLGDDEEDEEEEEEGEEE